MTTITQAQFDACRNKHDESQPLTPLFEFVAADDPSHDDEWQLLADRTWHIQILLSVIPGPDEYQVVHFYHNGLLGVPALNQHGVAFQDLPAAMHCCATLQANSIG